MAKLLALGLILGLYSFQASAGWRDFSAENADAFYKMVLERAKIQDVVLNTECGSAGCYLPLQTGSECTVNGLATGKIRYKCVITAVGPSGVARDLYFTGGKAKTLYGILEATMGAHEASYNSKYLWRQDDSPILFECFVPSDSGKATVCRTH